MSKTTKTKTVATVADSAVYMSAGGEIQLDVPLGSDTVWLTQAQMANLFGSSQRMMSYHTKNVFSDKELNRESNIQKMYIGGSDKPVLLHSLDVIISVGYRVKSVRGVHFRKWATEILRTRLLYAQRKRRDQRARVEALGALASHVLTDDEARALQRPRRDCPACCRKQPEAKRHGNPANIGDAFLTAH